MPESATHEFQDRLTGFLPKMRIWALGLTRNRPAAEDLVQDVAVKVLLANESFVLGTNFSAWVHKIMINHFISGVRNKREYNDLDQAPEIRACRQLSQMTLATRWTAARKLRAVFS
jgi:RNA polymerase sigma-70 factor (ECF subfamily)